MRNVTGEVALQAHTFFCVMPLLHHARFFLELLTPGMIPFDHLHRASVNLPSSCRLWRAVVVVSCGIVGCYAVSHIDNAQPCSGSFCQQTWRATSCVAGTMPHCQRNRQDPLSKRAKTGAWVPFQLVEHALHGSCGRVSGLASASSMDLGRHESLVAIHDHFRRYRGRSLSRDPWRPSDDTGNLSEWVTYWYVCSQRQSVCFHLRIINEAICLLGNVVETKLNTAKGDGGGEGEGDVDRGGAHDVDTRSDA